MRSLRVGLVAWLLSSCDGDRGSAVNADLVGSWEVRWPAVFRDLRVAKQEGPEAVLSVERSRVPEIMGAILERYTVLDVNIQEPPLDQVIARVFEEAHAQHHASNAAP